MPAAIEVEGLEKRYEGTLAVDIPDLRVEPRTTLALIGPSGCGKSSLLRLVIGLLRPDRGRVLVAGTPMEPSTRRPLRLRMGYVVQEGGLFPHLTAGANVGIVARDLGWDRARIEARIAELADLTRLSSSMLRRYPAELSGGQRQRVALMRALMLDPEILLLDEPLAALDPMIRSGLQEELRLLFGNLRKAVLLVTHDLAEAAFLGDEIALMRQGRIVQRGTYEDLAKRPADPFVTEFIRAQRPLRKPEESPA
jgi:osmoprotectant transport system ATP-binding protein